MGVHDCSNCPINVRAMYSQADLRGNGVEKHIGIRAQCVCFDETRHIKCCQRIQKVRFDNLKIDERLRRCKRSKKRLMKGMRVLMMVG